MIKSSLTLRVLVISFIVLALPLLIDSFIFFQRTYFDSIQGAKNSLKEVADFKRFVFSEIQPVKQVLLKEINYFLDLPNRKKDFNSNELDKELSILAHRMKDLQIIILKQKSEDNYEVVASSSPEFYHTVFKSYVVLENVRKHGQGSFARYIYSPITHNYNPFLFVARPIPTLGSSENYILVVASEITNQMQSILQRPRDKKEIELAILNYDNVVLDATVPSLRGQYFNSLSAGRKEEIRSADMLGNIPIAENPLPLVRNEGPFFEFIFNSQVQIAYRTPLEELGMAIVTFSSKQEFFGQAISHFLLIYTIYGVILILGAGITYWISSWISRPLRQLTDLMGQVSRGNLDVRFKKEPLGFEINLLGEIFNNTLNILLANIQKTEDEKVKKEIYKRELEIGRQAQASLLPSKLPQIKGAQIASLYLPVNATGGDFHDFFVRKTKEGEALFFGVTDAAGKGMSSCLFAVAFRSLLHSFAHIYDDVGMALSKTNNRFLEDAGDTGMFIRALQGVYYPDTKTLFYYSCGNIPGIVRKANGHLHTLEHSGMAIGLKESKGYHPDKIQLSGGDFVIFFTDGLVEAVNKNHQLFGERRLKNFLQNKNWLTPQEMIDDIVKEIHDFTYPVVQDQEITIVVLRVE